MKKKTLWTFLALFTVVAMLLMSCGTETTTEETEQRTTVVKGTTTTTTETPREIVKQPTSEEKPQYGGTAIVSLTVDLTGFDEVITPHYLAHSLKVTNQELLQGDVTKGVSGSGEADFILAGINNMSLKTGCLADSWQIPEKGTVIFHIKDNVNWQNKPPTSGRKLTVDDVVFSIQRMCTTPGAYIKLTYPLLANGTVVTGDEASRNVTIKVPDTEWANCLAMYPDYLSIMPRDACEQFGNLNDWRNSIGTGPFMLTDYVSGGSLTYKRNPNYWETNPMGAGKGDQLPYLDGVKMLIITDTATRIAAFRTQKTDSLGAEYDDIKEFLGNPHVKYVSYVSDSCYFLGMRTDDPNSAFSKKEVREALYYATDYSMIVDDYYSGKATILVWPMSYNRENAAAYVPLEKLPASIQDRFIHNVTKARELLTTAGYPTGINVNIICYNTATQVDLLSLVKQMWSEAGINVTLDAREYATWTSRLRARNFGANEMLYTYTSGVWQRLINVRGPTQYNASFINDSKIDDTYNQMMDVFGFDENKLAQLHAELMPYVLDQCYVWFKPNAYSYVVWWDYRKNYNGELSIGYYNLYHYLKYNWIDEALKREISR